MFLLKLLLGSEKVGVIRVYKLSWDWPLDAKTLSVIFDESEENIKVYMDILSKYELVKWSKKEIVINEIWKDPQRDRGAPEYKTWRKEVFERDDYTCQLCGIKGGNLQAHHKKSWISHKEDRFNIDNGITLCEKCHRQVHKRGEKDGGL